MDRTLSLSSVFHAQIGDRSDELAREMGEAMTPFAKDGLVTEVVESKALIARREPLVIPPAPA